MEPVEYREVPSLDVPYDTWRMGESALRLTRSNLKLRGFVCLRWFKALDWRDREARREGRSTWDSFWSDEPISGCVRRKYPGVIWVRADLSLLDTVQVIAHEARHLHQQQERGNLWCEGLTLDQRESRIAWQEADARAYAAAVRGWIED